MASASRVIIVIESCSRWPRSGKRSRAQGRPRAHLSAASASVGQRVGKRQARVRGHRLGGPGGRSTAFGCHRHRCMSFARTATRSSICASSHIGRFLHIGTCGIRRLDSYTLLISRADVVFCRVWSFLRLYYWSAADVQPARWCKRWRTPSRTRSSARSSPPICRSSWQHRGHVRLRQAIPTQ